MKTLTTLQKAITETTQNEYMQILDNKNIVFDTLTDNDKYFLLIYEEMKKAIDNKNVELILNINYAQSKKQDVDLRYCRLISKASKNSSLIQVYFKSVNAIKQSCFFDICSSCNEVNKAKFIALNDNYFVKVDKATNRAKTTFKTHIAYDDIISVLKTTLAVLSNEDTEKAKTSQSVKKDTQKATEKKSKK